MAARKTSKRKNPNALWGGRFKGGPSDIMEKINASVGFDQRLAPQDIAASKSHCEMLVKRGIISSRDGAAILSGLDKISKEIDTGDFEFKEEFEDVHMNIETRLAEIIGDAAGRLHTARSRNDQVATDFRLWVRDAYDGIDGQLADLQEALIEKAERHADTVMPGFTHLQTAQPVTFGHHMLAYVEMFGRDRGRVADGRGRLNECPLGSAALAGTSFPIDRRMTAKALGFDRPTANSLDAVADRDFALEFLAAAAISAVHLSRLADELVLWCSDSFSFIHLSDAFTTGSSIMPQKRNPDAAELVRAKSGRVIAAFAGLAVALKALPLAYAKDMQEDKEPVFGAADTWALSLAAMSGMVRDMRVDERAMRDAALRGHSTATDLADWLVRVLDLPFRRAHHLTGLLVKMAEDNGCTLADLSLPKMQSVEPRITADVKKVLSVEKSIASRRSLGGTAPANVRRACAEARKRFL